MESNCLEIKKQSYNGNIFLFLLVIKFVINLVEVFYCKKFFRGGIMKKIFKNLFIFLVFSLVFTVSISYKVKAEDKLKITNWVINSEVLEDGTFSIKEDITFKFSDKFNGVYRDIGMRNTSEFSDLKVFQKIDGKEIEYKKVEKGNKGDNGVYQVNNQEDNNISVKIFSPSKNEEKTFILSYKILNESIKYADTAELFYKFIGEENKTHIDNLKINIKLPQLAEKDKVKIFAHGPVNGVINFIEDGLINLQVENIKDERYVAGRILFPREYIKNSKNLRNEEAYSRILNEELIYTKEVEKNIEGRKKRKEIGNYGSFMFIGLSLVFIILISVKLRRKDKFYENDYYGMLPKECTPAVASVEYSYYLGSKDIIATILDLARKGYLSIEKIEDTKEELFMENKKKKHNKNREKDKNYKIIKIKSTDSNLLEHEIFFIQWIIDKIGDYNYVTLSKVREYSKSNMNEFINDYKKWDKLAKDEVKKKGFFDEKGKRYGTFLILFSIVELFAGIIFLIFNSMYGLAAVIAGSILLVWGIVLLYRKSDYGYIEYMKWKKFRDKMKNMKKYDIEREFSDYAIDQWIIYAISLGIDEKKINSFKPYVMSSTAYNNSYLYWYFLYGNLGHSNSFNKSIDSAFGAGVPSTGSGGGVGGAGGGGGAGGF